MHLRSGNVKRGISPTRDSSSKRRKLTDEIPVTQSNKSSASLPYGGLPPEIWYQICQLVLEKECTVAVYFRRVNRPAYTSKKLTKAPRLPDSRTSLALASTSRRMYVLATQIYYTKNAFYVGGSPRMDRFFAGIGTSNVNLITSIELRNGWNIEGEEPPWQAISKMASLKVVLVNYPEGVWQPWLSTLFVQIHVAFSDFNEYIKCLSHEKDEQPTGLPWGGTHSPSEPRFYWIPKEDRHKWAPFENVAGQGLTRRIVYSWGAVTGYIHNWGMCMKVERHKETLRNLATTGTVSDSNTSH